MARSGEAFDGRPKVDELNARDRRGLREGGILQRVERSVAQPLARDRWQELCASGSRVSCDGEGV